MAVARLGYEIDSSGAVVAADNLDDMAAAAKRAERGAGKLSGGAGKAGKALGGVTFNARMLVPQLSQIGQQFTATGQLGQAVAVQAADIGLAFGVVGTIIGTVAGVALPSLIGALGGGESAADKFTDALDDMNDAVGDFMSIADIVMTDMDKLTEKYGAQAAAVRALFQELVNVNKQQALNAAQSAIFAAREQFNELESALQDFADRRRELLRAQDIQAEGVVGILPSEVKRMQDEVAAAAQAIADDFDLTTAQAYRIVDALQAVEQAAGPEEAALAAANLASAIGSAADEGADLSTQMANVANSAAQAFAAVQEVIQAGAQASFAPGLNPTMDIGSLLPPTRRKRATRTAGGRADDFARDLERLQESLRTEREVVDAWYAEQQAILSNRRAVEILGIEGHNQAKLRLEQEYQERLAGVRSGYHGASLDQAQTFFGDMASALQGGNDKMIAAAQAFASVEALINAYRAYNQVIADPSLPWFAKIPAAVSVLAAGMRTVSAIKSVGNGGSRGAGGATSAGITATAATQPQPQLTRAIISLQGGRSRFTVEEINDIIRGIQKDSDDGVIIEGVNRA